jgi:hypothetical protein
VGCDKLPLSFRGREKAGGGGIWGIHRLRVVFGVFHAMWKRVEAVCGAYLVMCKGFKIPEGQG